MIAAAFSSPPTQGTRAPSARRDTRLCNRRLRPAIAEESRAVSRAVGDRGGEGAALNLLGHLARDRGDRENARALLRASLSDNPPLAPIGIAVSLAGMTRAGLPS